MAEWQPLDQAAVQELQDALTEAETEVSAAMRDAHKRLMKAADRLRQRAQVIAVGGPGDNEG